MPLLVGRQASLGAIEAAAAEADALSRRAARARTPRSPRPATCTASASSRGSSRPRGSANGTARILVEGMSRARASRATSRVGSPARGHRRGARITLDRRPGELNVLARRVLALFEEYVALHRRIPQRGRRAGSGRRIATRQAYGIAAHLAVRLERAPDACSSHRTSRNCSTRSSQMLASEIELLRARTEARRRRARLALPEPARVLSPGAAQGDPSRAGPGRHRRCDGSRAPARGAQAAGGGARRARCAKLRKLRRMSPLSPESTRGAQLPRLDPGAAVDGAHGRRARRRARAPHSRRGSLRPRGSEGAHPRLHRRAVARRAHGGPDPLPRRTAGRRQDVARPLDRARARPQVRAHVARRRARRGGDSRSPAHVHRRRCRAASSRRCAARRW